jgi:hypothetical protein
MMDALKGLNVQERRQALQMIASTQNLRVQSIFAPPPAKQVEKPSKKASSPKGKRGGKEVRKGPKEPSQPKAVNKDPEVLGLQNKLKQTVSAIKKASDELGEPLKEGDELIVERGRLLAELASAKRRLRSKNEDQGSDQESEK